MTEPSEPAMPQSTGERAHPAADSETAEQGRSGLELQYAGTIARIHSLQHQMHATERALEQALEKVRSSKLKLAEAQHYKSLVHRLRKRWYLRPFIPTSALEPREPSLPPLSDCWQFRGLRFTSRNSAGRDRVVVVGHELSENLFGAERSLIDVITAIDPQRFDVFAVFPQRNERVFEIIEERVQGICVFPYGWWHKNRPFQEHTVSQFEQVYRELGIDLVHANTITLSDPLIAAQRAGIPTISHARELILQDDYLASQLGAVSTEIAKTVCRNATYLLANSATTLANYPCGKRGGYFYNYVDPCAFDIPNAVDPDCIKIGLVSSNLPKKGIFDFLELACQAERLLPMLQFYLIGPETSFTREWRLAPHLLPSNFHLAGYFPQPPESYHALNVVLNLSRFAESFGRTLAEAMTARRPVIAYRRGALPELVDEGETGFLVPYLDLAAVLDRLSIFARHPERINKLGETARTRAIRRFSREAFGSAINTLYARLISEAKPAAG